METLRKEWEKKDRERQRKRERERERENRWGVKKNKDFKNWLSF